MKFDKALSALMQTYLRLAKENRSFVDSGYKADAFKVLIEQRVLLLEDVDILINELSASLKECFPDNSLQVNNVAEVIKTILVLTPENKKICDKAKSALTELVNSDKVVEENIKKLQSNIKSELERVRKGATGLKGYRQTAAFGSCFINKIR